MELRQLECFVKAAELGNFTRAAAQLYISQPALSKNISLLEKSLGVPLFHRNGKKVTLNETGREVLKHAQAILDHGSHIDRICHSAQNRSNRVITIRVMAASDYLPDILSSYYRLHPEVSIVSLQHNDEFEQADIVVYSTMEQRNQAAETTVLCESLAFAVPDGNPLYHRETVSFSQVAEHPIISLRTGNNMRTIEDHYFEAAGIAPYRAVECDTPSTLRGLIKSGFGVAFVPTVTWKSMLDPVIRLIPTEDDSCVRYINVSKPHPETADDTVNAFFDYIVSYFSAI